MPFQFGLERVLAWEQRKLHRQENLVGECHQSLAKVRVAIAGKQVEQLTIERDWLQNTTISGPDAASLGRYRLGVARALAILKEAQQQRELELREQTAKMLTLKNRVRVLEKLRDRQLAAYTYGASRELEQLAADSYLAQWGSKAARDQPQQPGRSARL
jgi:hypothetical protein